MNEIQKMIAVGRVLRDMPRYFIDSCNRSDTCSMTWISKHHCILIEETLLDDMVLLATIRGSACSIEHTGQYMLKDLNGLKSWIANSIKTAYLCERCG